MMRPSHRGTDPASLRRHVVKGSGEWATVPTCVRDAIADLLATAAQPGQQTQRATHRRATSGSRRVASGGVTSQSMVAESSTYSDASLSAQPQLRRHAEGHRHVGEGRASRIGEPTGRRTPVAHGPQDTHPAEISVTRASSYHPGGIVLPLSPLDDESLLLSVRSFDDAERLRLHAVRNAAAFHNNIEQLSRDCRLCLSPELRAAIQLHPLVMEDLKRQQQQQHHQGESMTPRGEGMMRTTTTYTDAVMPNLSRVAAERMRHEDALWNDVLDAVHALRKASVRFTANFFSDEEKRGLGIDPLLLPRDPLRGAQTAPPTATAGNSRQLSDGSPLHADATTSTPNTASGEDAVRSSGRGSGGAAMTTTAVPAAGAAATLAVTGLSSGPLRVPASSRRLFADARDDGTSVFISTVALQSDTASAQRDTWRQQHPRRPDGVGEFAALRSVDEKANYPGDRLYPSHDESAEVNGVNGVAEEDEPEDDRSPRRMRDDAMADIRISDDDEEYRDEGGADGRRAHSRREAWEERDSFDPITSAIVGSPSTSAPEAPTTDTDNEPRVHPYRGIRGDRGSGTGRAGAIHDRSTNPLADRDPRDDNDDESRWLAPPPPFTSTAPVGRPGSMHQEPRARPPNGLPPTSPVGHLAWSVQRDAAAAPASVASLLPAAAATTPNRSALLLNDIKHLHLGNSPLASPQAAARMSPEQILQALDELGPVPLAPPSTPRTRDDTVIHPVPRAIAVKKRTALIPKGTSPDRSGSVSPNVSSAMPSPANSQRSERGGGHFVLRGGTSPAPSVLTRSEGGGDSIVGTVPTGADSRRATPASASADEIRNRDGTRHA